MERKAGILLVMSKKDKTGFYNIELRKVAFL